MNEQIIEYRKLIARASRSYYAGEISWNDFMKEVPDIEDELIGDVIDIIEHEPKRGGFLGVNEDGWYKYRMELLHSIEALERSIE